MPIYLITNKLKALLERMTHSRLLLPVIGILSAGSSISMCVPLEAIVIPPVLLAPRRWIGIWLSSVLGSSAGGAILAYLVHTLGWSTLHAHFPQIASSQEWRQIADWVEHYGFWALTVIAMLPLPETPAIIVASLIHEPIVTVFLALLIGKLVKYGLIAWLAATFPHRFRDHLRTPSFPQTAIAPVNIGSDGGSQSG